MAPSGISNSPVGPTEPAVITLARSLVGNGTGDFGCALVEIVDAILGLVQFQAVARAAERVG